MVGFLRGLSARAEFAAVVAIAFGHPIYSSIRYYLQDLPAPLDDRRLYITIVYELVLMSALGAFLRLRGWRLDQIGLLPSGRETLGRETLQGLGLALLCYAALFATWGTAEMFMPARISEVAQHRPPVGALSLAAVVATSLVNAVFEEALVLGYIVTALKRRDAALLGAAASVAIRVAYHLYQHENAYLGVLPIGLILTVWYVRTGRLWPVVVMHALWDLLAMLPYAGHGTPG